MKVEYDLYKSPPREVDGKEVVHLHARVARSKTISIWSLGDDIQKATSLTKSDLRADRKSTRLNSSHNNQSRMPSSA